MHDPHIVLSAALIGASHMTAAFRDIEPTAAYCGNCRGTGFDKMNNRSRHARKCQRCRGQGRVRVGHTKR
jgi:DnaJ-class molecular chaperone